jgi:hypothetical protein
MVTVLMYVPLSVESIVNVFVPPHTTVTEQPVCVTVHSVPGEPQPIDELGSAVMVYAPWTSSHLAAVPLSTGVVGQARQMPIGFWSAWSVDAADMSQKRPFEQFAVDRQPLLQMLMEQYSPPLHGIVWPMHEDVPSVLLGVHVPPPPPPPPPVPLLAALFVVEQARTMNGTATMKSA